MSEKSGCVPLHWQHCRVSVSMSVLPARERARTGHSFQNCQASRFLQRGARVDGGSRSRGGLSGLNRVRGGDPWCSGALSADGRWVRIHTTAPAVGSASKLSAPGALRRTSEVGSSHSLSAYDDSPTIVLERYYSARRKLCNLTKAAATAQPLRRGNTCVDSVAHPTASTSRRVVAPKAVNFV